MFALEDRRPERRPERGAHGPKSNGLRRFQGARRRDAALRLRSPASRRPTLRATVWPLEKLTRTQGDGVQPASRFTGGFSPGSRLRPMTIARDTAALPACERW